jgi:hypothetical protein
MSPSGREAGVHVHGVVDRAVRSFLARLARWGVFSTAERLNSGATPTSSFGALPPLIDRLKTLLRRPLSGVLRPFIARNSDQKAAPFNDQRHM